MRTIRHLVVYIGLVALVVTSAPVRAEDETAEDRQPLLWVMEGKPTVYLFGTIHIPDERVLALPKVVTDALAASDVFWSEIPLEVAEKMKMQAGARLPAGTTLPDVLSKEDYDRLASFMKSKGFPVQMFHGFKVWVVAVTAQVIDILPQLAMRKTLDDHLYELAKQAGKALGGLETSAENLAVFDGMSAEQQARFLVLTLDQMEKHEKEVGGFFERLVKLYLDGDPDKILAALYEDYNPDSDVEKLVIERVLDDRSKRMAERIHERTKEDPDKTYFVAVGAAHYPGKNGIVELLKAKGAKVRRVKVDEEIPVPAEQTR